MVHEKNYGEYQSMNQVLIDKISTLRMLSLILFNIYHAKFFLLFSGQKIGVKPSPPSTGNITGPTPVSGNLETNTSEIVAGYLAGSLAALLALIVFIILWRKPDLFRRFLRLCDNYPNSDTGSSGDTFDLDNCDFNENTELDIDVKNLVVYKKGKITITF